MKMRPLLAWLAFSLMGQQGLVATDIVTLSGKKYLDVHDVQVRGTMLTFSTASEIVKVPLADVPPTIKERYLPKPSPTPVVTATPLPPVVEAPPDALPVVPPVLTGPLPTNPHDLVVATGNRYLAQMAADLQTAQSSGPASYTVADGYTVAKLDDANRDALTNGRPVAFFILDDALLNVPSVASEASPNGAFAHYMQTFRRSVTPVFVFPKRDLGKLPGILTIALGKPMPVPVPRVIFTNSDSSEVLWDLALATPRQTFAQRTEAIYPAVGMIKLWYVKVANALPSK